MFSEEEKRLTDMKQQLEQVEIPKNIDAYIMGGIHKVEKARQRKRRTVFASFTFAAILFLSVLSIRVSPAFASFVSQVPGLEKIVALIQGDKGLTAAVQNDFFQEVDKSVTHNGITFTVDKIIADESRLIIFYSVVTDKDFDHLSLSNIDLLNEQGESIIGYAHNNGLMDIKKGERVNAKIDIGMDESKEFPKQVTLKTNIGKGESKEEGNWVVNFPIDHEKFFGNKQIIPINETIIVEDQKILFKEMTIYPTKVAIHVNFDDQNTKEIFSFDDLRVVNENGEEWTGTANGITATIINDNEKVFYLDSNFFDKGKRLFLQFSSIRALDKNKQTVVIDLAKQAIIERPDGNVQLTEVKELEENDSYELTFLVKSKHPMDQNYFYQVFEHQYFDSLGNAYNIESLSYRNIGDSAENYFVFSVKNVKDKRLIFKINDYSTRITKDVKLRVK